MSDSPSAWWVVCALRNEAFSGQQGSGAQWIAPMERARCPDSDSEMLSGSDCRCWSESPDGWEFPAISRRHKQNIESRYERQLYGRPCRLEGFGRQAGPGSERRPNYPDPCVLRVRVSLLETLRVTAHRFYQSTSPDLVHPNLTSDCPPLRQSE